jgi:hypothetical protein
MSYSSCQSEIRQYHTILISEQPSWTDIFSVMPSAESFGIPLNWLLVLSGPSYAHWVVEDGAFCIVRICLVARFGLTEA